MAREDDGADLPLAGDSSVPGSRAEAGGSWLRCTAAVWCGLLGCLACVSGSHRPRLLQVADVSALAPGSQPEKDSLAHQCLECTRTFSSAAVLAHHSKEAHGRERIHGCRICRKAFKRATHLKVRPWDRSRGQHTRVLLAEISALLPFFSNEKDSDVSVHARVLSPNRCCAQRADCVRVQFKSVSARLRRRWNALFPVGLRAEKSCQRVAGVGAAGDCAGQGVPLGLASVRLLTSGALQHR